jgi:hypothetical protein
MMATKAMGRAHWQHVEPGARFCATKASARMTATSRHTPTSGAPPPAPPPPPQPLPAVAVRFATGRQRASRPRGASAAEGVVIPAGGEVGAARRRCKADGVIVSPAAVGTTAIDRGGRHGNAPRRDGVGQGRFRKSGPLPRARTRTRSRDPAGNVANAAVSAAGRPPRASVAALTRTGAITTHHQQDIFPHQRGEVTPHGARCEPRGTNASPQRGQKRRSRALGDRRTGRPTISVDRGPWRPTGDAGDAETTTAHELATRSCSRSLSHPTPRGRIGGSALRRVGRVCAPWHAFPSVTLPGHYSALQTSLAGHRHGGASA